MHLPRCTEPYQTGKNFKIKLNFINNRAYPISLEPKNRNQTENQMNT